MSLYGFYFEQQDKYYKIYGSKTIVFIQVGSFYEAYCTKFKGYSDLEKLEAILNVKFIRRDKKENNKPHQLGFPSVSLLKNLAILNDNGYTIVIFDQCNNGSEIERKLTGIFSPGTFLSDKQIQDSNYILSVYIVEEKQLFSKKNLMAIGITLVDVNTGYSMVHEFYASKDDEKFGLDELIRIIQIFKPSETIIYFHTISENKSIINNIKIYLELDKITHFFYVYHNKKGNDVINLLKEDYFKINFQNKFFSEIYDFNNQILPNKMSSPIEILNLEKRPYAAISLIIILKFISEHNINLLKNISYPEIYIYNEHLILGNNAIEQLNIVDSNNLEFYNKQIKSLFDVVNKTCTPMGRRFLKHNLLNPLSQNNKELIKQRYDIIDNLLKDNLYSKLHNELKNIYDIEKLHRRMAMGIIMPYEFYRLDLFYQSTTKIISMIKDNNVIKNIMPDQIIKDFLEYQINYNKEFIFDELQKYSNFNDIDNSLFKKGIHFKIDEIQDNINYTKSVINATLEFFKNILSKKCNSMYGKELITIESNDRDGYYFSISKTREQILKQELKKHNNIKISLNIGKNLEIANDDIIFKPLTKGRTKIFISPLIEYTTNLTKYISKLRHLTKKIFINTMLEYYKNNKFVMNKISKFIAELDFLNSGAIVANKYYYCKPSILSNENIPSYLVAKSLRHAIIERLIKETEYIPNDIEIGNLPDIEEKKNGILLYGLNSSGKTSCMKAIGIAVILAQIGYYVPAEKFIYEPYMALYARITGNDNIFKGLSSFALEITEIDAILKRISSNGKNTLVIGDEVCRGTEAISGTSIIVATLVMLSESGCSFIFSSHLHNIPDIDEIKKLNNLRIFHIRVEYDEENDCLVFDRKMLPGQGPSIYGLMVAKYLVKNNKFITIADKIKNRLTNENKNELPIKKSKFNKDLLITECAICYYSPTQDYHKELESHHINFQKNCWKDGKIKEKPYLNKNRLSNLVILCRKCHEKVHKDEITINGYADTSLGPLIDYHINYNKIINKNFNSLKNLNNN